ncbi:alpha/beta fold hydrolase [Acidianus brierleyi]|uniref:Alpha/beta hydrolase n=1 Tax=Acidianus brierleyi TaxID=41673 RepID=A0A2U9IF43_9CREN|nr:alpha/beta hydrolase [Acidianus brierleyi]AWR94663.1 alpha/beta fold hydrolase [Acidianus brierleyi]
MPFAILDEVKIYYEMFGEGKPIVFIHHLAGSYKSWSQQSYYFSKKYNVLVYDLRGHGRSSVPLSPYRIEDHVRDLNSLLEYLEIKNPIIVGHSIGTLIALDFALKYSLDKLILIGALYKSPDPEPYRRYISIADTYGMEALALYRKMNKEFSSALVENQTAWNELLNVYRDNSPIGYRYAVEGLLLANNYEKDIEKIDSPTLIVYGSDDKLIQNLKVLRKLKNYDENIISGFGHFLNFEAPDELNKAIAGFL